MANETTDTRVIQSQLASTRENSPFKRRKKKNPVDAVFGKSMQTPKRKRTSFSPDKVATGTGARLRMSF